MGRIYSTILKRIRISCSVKKIVALIFNMLGSKEGSSKTVVIDILLDNPNLTAKEIYGKAKREKNYFASYQSIFKTLKILVTEKTVVKSGFKYSINNDWLDELRNRIDQSKRLFAAKDYIGVTVLPNLYEVDKFLIGFLRKIAETQKNKQTLFFIWSHFWIPFLIDRSEYKILQKITSYFDIFAVSKSDTFLDKWCVSFWEKLGAKTKVATNLKLDSDLVIIEDYVLTVHYPKETRDMIKKYYSDIKGLNDLDSSLFFDEILLFGKDVCVTVLNDKQLASIYKNKFIDIFD